MVTIIKDENWVKRLNNIKPDAKKRVVLPKSIVGDDITYHIYSNEDGQIILDPQVTIPASELWLFENKNLLALIDKGMAESANGKLINRGSFAKYVKDEA